MRATISQPPDKLDPFEIVKTNRERLQRYPLVQNYDQHAGLDTEEIEAGHPGWDQGKDWWKKEFDAKLRHTNGDVIGDGYKLVQVRQASIRNVYFADSPGMKTFYQMAAGTKKALVAKCKIEMPSFR